MMPLLTQLPDPPREYTIAQIASILGIDRHHIYNAITRGQLQCIPKAERGVRLLAEAEVLRWWNDLQTQADAKKDKVIAEIRRLIPDSDAAQPSDHI